ncbi:unnamed protein product [Bursaphelenchus xylophilus]|nr:unnamed protein product [Bursaphelenchus xylophilus]CAG9111929.1 unnamed protein product [Bursaphelenchus xylophilus]
MPLLQFAQEIFASSSHFSTIRILKLLLLLLFNFAQASRDYCANETDIIDHILYDTTVHYNRHKTPNDPVEVRIELWVQEVTSVSEMTQDFEIDLYVNEFWEDPALAYDYMRPCKMNLSFDHTMMNTIWIPNTAFINSKSAQIHSSPFRNVFLMIFPNGSIWSCWRIKSRGPCLLDLYQFPMDKITCFLTFESYNYNRNLVRMMWNAPSAVLLYKDIELPDFSLTNYTWNIIEKQYAAGVWDELSVHFAFKRRYGWYLLQGYIPTYLTIFISWIPFYLGPRAIPARTMIGVNALLAMTFQFGNVIRNLPRVNYIKVIDWWVLSGMSFVFGSLIELAVIGFKMRNEGNSLKIKDLSKKRKFKKKTAVVIRCERLDLMSRYLFPLMFTLFNLVYWGRMIINNEF